MTEERIREIAKKHYDRWPDATECYIVLALTTAAIRESLAEDRAALLALLQANCATGTNPGAQTLAYQALRILGERGEAK